MEAKTRRDTILTPEQAEVLTTEANKRILDIAKTALGLKLPSNERVASQARVERIFKEIENLLFECEDWETQWLLSKSEWQALKKQEGV